MNHGALNRNPLLYRGDKRCRLRLFLPHFSQSDLRPDIYLGSFLFEIGLQCLDRIYRLRFL